MVVYAQLTKVSLVLQGQASVDKVVLRVVTYIRLVSDEVHLVPAAASGSKALVAAVHWDGLARFSAVPPGDYTVKYMRHQTPSLEFEITVSPLELRLQNTDRTPVVGQVGAGTAVEVVFLRPASGGQEAAGGGYMSALYNRGGQQQDWIGLFSASDSNSQAPLQKIFLPKVPGSGETADKAKGTAVVTKVALRDGELNEDRVEERLAFIMSYEPGDIVFRYFSGSSATPVGSSGTVKVGGPALTCPQRVTVGTRVTLEVGVLPGAVTKSSWIGLYQVSQVHTHAHTHTRTYRHTYRHMHTHMHAQVHTHIHTHKLTRSGGWRRCASCVQAYDQSLGQPRRRCCGVQRGGTFRATGPLHVPLHGKPR
jgi:hypothetical protein